MPLKHNFISFLLLNKFYFCSSFFQFDKSLRKQHEFYEHYRQFGTICEACVEVVRPGSFNKLKTHIIANSTANYNQFKMPKKLRTKVLLDFMQECVVNNNN